MNNEIEQPTIERRRYQRILSPQPEGMEPIITEDIDHLAGIMDTLVISFTASRRKSGNYSLLPHISLNRHEAQIPLELYRRFPGGSFGRQDIPGKRPQYIWSLNSQSIIYSLLQEMAPHCIVQQEKMLAGADLIERYSQGSIDNLRSEIAAFRELADVPYTTLPNADYLSGVFDSRGHIRLDGSQTPRKWPLTEVSLTPPHQSLVDILKHHFDGYTHHRNVWLARSNVALQFLKHIQPSSKVMSKVIDAAIEYQTALSARNSERVVRDQSYFTPLPDEIWDSHATQIQPLIDTFEEANAEMYELDI